MNRPMNDAELEEFMGRVSVGPENACWEWLGSTNLGGYGQVYVAGKTRPAHRVAWENARGPIPPGKCVCHKCDNPGCVNPEHMFLGDHSDNMRDAADKGRSRGPSSGFKKLTQAEAEGVRSALEAGESRALVAKRLGVSWTTIHKIATGQSHKRAEK